MVGLEVLAYYYVTWAKVFPDQIDGLGLPYKRAYENALAMFQSHRGKSAAVGWLEPLFSLVVHSTSHIAISVVGFFASNLQFHCAEDLMTRLEAASPWSVADVPREMV